MATPPNDRVRAIVRETYDTGGGAGDERPTPKVINPNDDMLDARGIYMQSTSGADTLVAIWRDPATGTMQFRDATLGAGVSYSLADLAASGGGSSVAPIKDTGGSDRFTAVNGSFNQYISEAGVGQPGHIFQTPLNASRIIDARSGGVTKFEVDIQGNVNIPAGCEYRVGGVPIGSGSGGGTPSPHTVFTKTNGSDGQFLRVETQGNAREEFGYSTAAYGHWRWMANLEGATWTRLSCVLWNAPGHSVTMVAEGSLDGGATWMPLCFQDPAWVGYHGFGGPDVLLVPGDVNSEWDMRGAPYPAEHMLRSYWYPIDPVFRRHDVWIRLAFHNPDQAPGIFEFSELKLEVGYWTGIDYVPDSENHSFDPIKDLPDPELGLKRKQQE